MNDELERLMREATARPWIPGHHTNPDHPCNCRSILAEGYFGSIATVNQSLTRDIEDGDCPPPEEAIANALLIVAAVNALPELLALREEVGRLREARVSQSNYTIDLQRIIEDLCKGRDIREPKTGARHHYNMAVAYLAALNQEPGQ